MHDLSLIVVLAGALAVALVCGWLTERLGLSTLVGYMLAGIAVGPFTPGFVADAQLASQMAEIGVILLMYGVGMHFHPHELLRVWRLAVPGAVGQSAVAGLAGWAMARALGWSDAAGIVFGMALAVASTVVLMRMLVERDRLNDRAGHVAVGWLIVEDIFTVIALVVLPVLAAPGEGVAAAGGAIAVALGKAALFAVLVWGVGTRVVNLAMDRIARTRSTELFTLSAFVLALGVALLASEVFHVSVALGAFFAGLVIGRSRFGPQAAADMAPFRDVFSALFFVSVGMLFDPRMLLEDPTKLLLALGIVLVVKPAAALAIVALLRGGARAALTVAVGLAQIGEFSFLLAALGRSMGVLPAEAFNVLVGAAILSIALNPLLFRWLPALERRAGGEGADEEGGGDGRPAGAAPAQGLPAGERAGLPVVVVGSGELVRRFLARCAEARLPVAVMSQDLPALEAAQAQGMRTVYGDAAQPAVLEAGLDPAELRVAVLAEGDLMQKMRACQALRAFQPRVAIVAVAASAAERGWMEEFGVAHVCDAFDEMSEALLRATRGAL